MTQAREPRVAARAPLEVRFGRAAVLAFAFVLMSRVFRHYIEDSGPDRWIPAVILLTAVVALYVATGFAGPLRDRRHWAVAAMALLVYAPLPFLGAWWATSGIFLAAAALGFLPRPFSLPAFALVLFAEAFKSRVLGDPPQEMMSWTLTVAVMAVCLAGLTHFAETARVLYATRAELVTFELSAQRARAMRELERVLGSRLDAIAAQGREVLRGADGEAENVKKELRDMLELAREAQREMRGFAHREQRMPSRPTNRPR
ncbi:hypothetical protein ACFHYQ_22690 [Sphaerimonospora cavernae]|uniref:Histidine kinase n=1 Tax=Sphaerimonospora cavernae TaxID=1740611 RepID=A0ABV6UAC8_9ACTN